MLLYVALLSYNWHVFFIFKGMGPESSSRPTKNENKIGRYQSNRNPTKSISIKQKIKQDLITRQIEIYLGEVLTLTKHFKILITPFYILTFTFYKCLTVDRR